MPKIRNAAADFCYTGHMNTYKRYLEMDLPQGQSAFLWGARQTGKSTYLEEHFSNSIHYDLLETDLFTELSIAPHLLREEVTGLTDAELAHPIIIDEIQKVPMLLNEVHWLIEHSKAYFILCGSSARKLRRGAANLLGGRAWRYTFYPLVSAEIPDFDLLRALQNGLLPKNYGQADATKSLEAYINNYLREEIYAEGVTQNLPAFSKFLEALAFSHGGLIKYANIARDCGVSANTVKAYFQILVDTLLGYEVYPFTHRKGRDVLTKTPKFYLFDVGVVNYLADRQISTLKGAAAGEAFEHFIFMELMAYRELNSKRYDINFWRTQKGLEVDFVLAKGRIALEIKISQKVEKQDLKGLFAFAEDYQPEQAIVVSQDPRRRKLSNANGVDILVLPWQEFLEKLWGHELL